MNFFARLFKKRIQPHDPPPVTAGLGIALSGGSARGFAHIGVLKALSEHGVEPEVIAGTSMGSIVGVLYAAGYTPDEIQEIVTRRRAIRMVRLTWSRRGLFDMRKVRKTLESKIKTDDFSALKKPFFVTVSNINLGKSEIISSGKLFDYVIASSSVPVIFAPQVINNVTYVDGGLYNNLPANAIRDKCKILIGSHVNYIGKVDNFHGLRHIAERAFTLGIDYNVIPSKKLCDFLIEPPKMQEYSYWDFGKAPEIVEVGYNHTKKMIESGQLPIDKLKPQ